MTSTAHYNHDEALHRLAVDWTTHGYAEASLQSRLFYSRWASNHQLTTGPSYADDLIDFVAQSMPDVTLAEWQKRFLRTYFADHADPDPGGWYPGQPVPRHEPLRPCTCFYGLRHVDGVERGPWEHKYLFDTAYVRVFVMVWDCPHHGDDAYDWPQLHAAADEVEAAFWSTLAEEERAG